MYIKSPVPLREYHILRPTIAGALSDEGGDSGTAAHLSFYSLYHYPPSEFYSSLPILHFQIFEKEPLSKFPNLKRESWRDIIDELSNKGDFNFELGAYDSPYDDYDPKRWWTFEKIFEEGTVLLSRPKDDQGFFVPSEGFIRPISLRLSIPLHNRKVKAVHRFKMNRNLIQVFLSPKTAVIQLNDRFNNSSLITQVLNTIPIFLIQEPPGTGKTWTATEVVKEILMQDPTARILISSKEHEPLDHLVERVTEVVETLNIHPKPIMIRLMPYEREAFYFTKPKITQFFEKHVTMNLLDSAKNWQPSIQEWNEEAEKWRELMKAESVNPGLSWQWIVRNCANIVFTTATSKGLQNLQKYAPPFDWVIIEEAGKSYAPELLIPMTLGQRWLLIGDQRQLPPYKIREIMEIIHTNLTLNELFNELDEPAKIIFEQTLIDEAKIFDNLYRKYFDIAKATHRLEKQWRLVPVISDMIGRIFYNTSFDNQKEPLKPGIPFSGPEFLAKNELIWIKTPYSGNSVEFAEKLTNKGGYINKKEAEIIKKILNNLKRNPEFDSRTLEIVIITPYNSQKLYLINYLEDEFIKLRNMNCDLVCHTVDGYQGRQADLILISLVRNNRSETIRNALGFLTTEERLNVMLSRSRMRMILVGCIEHFRNFFSESEV